MDTATWHRLSNKEGDNPTCSICGPTWVYKKGTNKAACGKKKSQQKQAQQMGITVERYEQMFKEQKGLCAACLQPSKNGQRLAIDHDHSCCPSRTSCGKCVRRLLCTSCNLALGHAGDDPVRLRALADYVEKAGCP